MICFLAVRYSVPLIFYALNFGVYISSDHTRWAEFGSAMSGIYAPIIAITTLAVLLAQVGLQKKINDHEFNQSHISQAREDIEFYAEQLSAALNAIAIPGRTFRSVLHSNFQLATVADLDSPELRTLAANIDLSLPGVLGMWFGVYPILTGLAAVKQRPFEMTLNSSLQKLIALLSFETCVALDNYYRVRTEGKMKVNYKFSPLLETKSVA